MAIVTFRYWAAAKEAAGVGEETIRAETLGEALAAASGNARGAATRGAATRGAATRGADAGSGNAGSGNAGSGNAGSGNAGSGKRPARDAGLNSRLRDVLARSSFLIDGQPVGVRPPEAVTLADASVIEVLPPFAGG